LALPTETETAGPPSEADGNNDEDEIPPLKCPRTYAAGN